MIEENTVKICDVGICKEVDIISGIDTGTHLYNAPEVFRSELYDFKADIYSFGIMLWEIWFGRRAFADVNLSDKHDFFRLVDDGHRPKDVEDFKKPPRFWKELMEECWDGDPEKRPTAKKYEQKITELSYEWSG
ncbi:Dual serine/threonine and tyrosine protein kinase [Stylophora pistillata]|uniref:Dual serine/threonine and tyrosine protein kinase n=1 Tax=Stylophora pistillata TaxID=50429 RepID=A0A2B4RG18_STYPI|nr:Dual serine/threonine and tyrosine protein kinase [Stylophora pistillata]